MHRICLYVCLHTLFPGPLCPMPFLDAVAALASALVAVLACSMAFVGSEVLPSALLGTGQGTPQQRLQELDLLGELGGWLDNTVPLKAASGEANIVGSEIPVHQLHRARSISGQLNGGQFLSDSVIRDPNHLGIYGGMYWGQKTATKPKSRRARGLVRRGDKWLRVPAAGQRGASDAEVGGIIKALEHQKSPPPPEWWVHKRQEWLQKQRIAAEHKAITKHLIKINPDFTGRSLDAEKSARYAQGPALRGLRPVSLHKMPQAKPHVHRNFANLRDKRHSNILIMPGKHLVHPKHLSAAAGQRALRARIFCFVHTLQLSLPSTFSGKKKLLPCVLHYNYYPTA